MVSPEPPDDARQVFRKHALLLGSTGQCEQLPGIIRTLGVSKVNLQVAHGFDDGHDRLDGVAVDNRTVLPALFL